MKHYSHGSHNDYGDVFASFPLSLLAHQHGLIYESPECYTTLSSFPEAIHDAWAGLIGDGEEYICNRPTLNKLQTILREDYGIIVECIYKKFAWSTDIGFYCMVKTKNVYSEHLRENTYNEDYNLSLESGLSYAIEQYIIP